VITRLMSSSPAPASTPAVDAPLSLGQLKFTNTPYKSLPIDPVENSSVRRPVANACYSIMKPTPVDNPTLVALSQPALDLLGPESARQIYDQSTEEGKLAVNYLSGNERIPGGIYASHCYCGHQFGSFAGQLGDGAAISVGEVENPKDSSKIELQLKGAGPTPYSRDADGRKVLRSSLREFLASEALFHLGIPTTRAASIVTSDSYVPRDPNYSGAVIPERCSIVSRLAPSFLRLGSFEIFKPQDPFTGRQGPSVGNGRLCVQMLNYAISRFYPDLWDNAGQSPKEESTSRSESNTDVFLDPSKLAGLNFPDKFVGEAPEARLTLSGLREVYRGFVLKVTERTAELVAEWQAYGFCHGVLNTDNISIHGVTIDYGPYGMMDYFDNNFICNGSDHDGRYDYKSQPEICKWNMGKFAEALSFPPFPTDLLVPPRVPERMTDATEDSTSDKWTSEVVSQFDLGHVLPLGTIKADIAKTYDAAFADRTYKIWEAKLGVSVYSALALPPVGAEVLISPEGETKSSGTSMTSSQTLLEIAQNRFKGLIGELFYVMHETYCDMTLVLRALSATRSTLQMRLAQVAYAQTPEEYQQAVECLKLAFPTEAYDSTAASTFKCTSASQLQPFDPSCNATSDDNAFDPVLEAILGLCSTADHYNRRREALKPHEPMSELLRMRAALADLALRRPNLKLAIAHDLEGISRKLDAFALYERGSDITPSDKSQRDRELWSRWLRSYRCVLQAEEARLLLLQKNAIDPRLEERLRERASSGSIISPLLSSPDDIASHRINLEHLGITDASHLFDSSEAVWSAMKQVHSAIVSALESSPDRINSDLGKLWRTTLREISSQRHRIQTSSNPRFTLRNFIAQEVIASAEEGDFTAVKALLRVLEDPYDITGGKTQGLTPVPPEEEEAVAKHVAHIRDALSKLPPIWAQELCVTCSS